MFASIDGRTAYRLTSYYLISYFQYFCDDRERLELIIFGNAIP